ncbi:hypothetical protein HPT25_27695 [Bacillus sp. BRMEA1]|uniref:hypothetical protein n=1 Tax=Neobacillus endophyticus TaxID=2738405 RepID=UPI0015634231|nr:hypothetical protein [Neobacillus endophyticus]NRD81080.1 hypothetical protein [Neobacillus endophyticus]
MHLDTELLSSSKVLKFVESTKNSKLLVDEVEMVYSLQKKKVMLKGGGIMVFEHYLDEGYFENFEMSLEHVVLSWYGPLVLLLNCDTTATIKINPDGSYKEDNISISCNLVLSNKGVREKWSYLFNQLKKVVQLHKYIKNVTFRIHNHQLTNITINFNIDRKEFSATLRKLESPNMGLYNQWLTIVKHVRENTFKQYNQTYEVPIHNGKMMFNLTRETIQEHLECDHV